LRVHAVGLANKYKHFLKFSNNPTNTCDNFAKDQVTNVLCGTYFIADIEYLQNVTLCTKIFKYTMLPRQYLKGIKTTIGFTSKKSHQVFLL